MAGIDPDTPGVQTNFVFCYPSPLLTPIVDTRCENPHALGQNARDFFFEPVVDTRWQKTRC